MRVELRVELRARRVSGLRSQVSATFSEEVRLDSCQLASFSLLRVPQVFDQTVALFGTGRRFGAGDYFRFDQGI